jgi:hypothetical protein
MIKSAIHWIRQFIRLDNVLVMIGAGIIFSLIWLLEIPTDIQDHHYDLQMMLQGKHFVATFGYFLAVYILSFGIPHPYALIAGSVILLSLAVGVKYILIKKYLKIDQQKLLLLFSISLLLLTNLPGPKNFLIGQFPPNLWHNSTSIFLMPFAIGLFWQGLKYWENPSQKIALNLLILLLINVIIKPSFVFVFVPVFGLMSLWRWKLSKAFWRIVGVGAIALLLIILEYVAIFQWNSFRAGPQPETGLTIAPFHVWSFHSSNIPWSLLASIAFPLSYIIIFPKRLKASFPLQFAWALFAFGLVIFILIAETGLREYDANFIWQCYISNFLLFLVTVKDWQQNQISTTLTLSLTLLFSPHLLSGIAYLVKIFILKNYY